MNCYSIVQKGKEKNGMMRMDDVMHGRNISLRNNLSPLSSESNDKEKASVRKRAKRERERERGMDGDEEK